MDLPGKLMHQDDDLVLVGDSLALNFLSDLLRDRPRHHGRNFPALAIDKLRSRNLDQLKAERGNVSTGICLDG